MSEDDENTLKVLWEGFGGCHWKCAQGAAGVSDADSQRRIGNCKRETTPENGSLAKYWCLAAAFPKHLAPIVPIYLQVCHVLYRRTYCMTPTLSLK